MYIYEKEGESEGKKNKIQNSSRMKIGHSSISPFSRIVWQYIRCFRFAIPMLGQKCHITSKDRK